LPATVLVTGATGLLGGALAAHLLAARPDLQLICLARGAGGVEPRERVLRSLRRFGDPVETSFAGRLAITSGDLGDLPTLAALPFTRITHVVHLALDAGSSARAAAVNLEGTLALARAAQGGGRLERFLYIGSAWSCGSGARGVVREDDAPRGEPVSDHLLHKATIERRLEGVRGLPLVIARPSLVVGHTTLGCEPSASLVWLIRLLDHVGRLPWEKRHRLDVVPVDWVASALDHLLLAPRLAHPRYHLSAGATGSVSWADIESAFGREGGRPRRYEEAPSSLAGWIASIRTPEASGMTLPETTLLACLRFLGSDAVFDDTRARALGIPAAPRLTDYLEVCLRRACGRTIAAQALDDV
jgi:nucleoside-diphosphate-sugar epimerase